MRPATNRIAERRKAAMQSARFMLPRELCDTISDAVANNTHWIVPIIDDRSSELTAYIESVHPNKRFETYIPIWLQGNDGFWGLLKLVFYKKTDVSVETIADAYGYPGDSEARQDMIWMQDSMVFAGASFSREALDSIPAAINEFIRKHGSPEKVEKISQKMGM